MDKLLSVVVPTYNMEALLPRCLDSFILEKEDMDMLEVIVVNDGSKDSSSLIAHEYQRRYPNTFVVLDKQNGNYGSCINAALNMAKGEFMRICDSDDYYYNENLSEYLLVLKNSKADIVFSPCEVYNINGKLIKEMPAYCVKNGEVFNISEIDWRQPEVLRYSGMHCICVKTDNLRKNNYRQLEGISYTDTQFVFYAVLYSETCAFFNKPIYKYFLGREGQTMSLESMKKTNMHLYLNIRNMLDTYMTLKNSIPENKALLLCGSIRACFLSFTIISIANIRRSSEQIKLIQTILEDSKNCKLPCPLNEIENTNIIFRLWYRYHLHPFVIYYMLKFYRTIKRELKKIIYVQR